MVRGSLSAYGRRVRAELGGVAAETHPPRDVAASFAIGVFITTLPTLGTGLLLFVLIAYRFERVSKLALFASVVVLNPLVKWGVYGASFWLGTRLLGPVPGVSHSTVSFALGPEVLSRLIVGNLVLAVVFTIVGYVVVLRLVDDLRRRTVDVDGLLPDLEPK